MCKSNETVTVNKEELLKLQELFNKGCAEAGWYISACAPATPDYDEMGKAFDAFFEEHLS